MDSLDIISYLLALTGVICVLLSVGFVIFLIFEDFFRKVFKMRKNNGSLGGHSTVSDDASYKKKD